MMLSVPAISSNVAANTTRPVPRTSYLRVRLIPPPQSQRRDGQATGRWLEAPVAPVVAPVRAPIVAVPYHSRRADDPGGSRDRSAAEYTAPASTSWTQRHVKLLPFRFRFPLR